MGNCCGNPGADTKNQMNLSKPGADLDGNDPEVLNSVTKIQAHYRGHQVRKTLDDKPTQEPVALNSEGHAPPQHIAKPTEFNPNTHSNATTKGTLEKCGPFKYNSNDLESYKAFPTLTPYEFENGAIYIGKFFIKIYKVRLIEKEIFQLI
jgi:hypothetical protein